MQLTRRQRKAFSLIELVVVLTILAIVSGLTVSIVGWMRRSADKAAAAHTMGSLLSNIEMHRTVYNGNYSDQFDSLIESGGTNLHDGDAATADKGLDSGLLGATGKLTTTTLTAGEVKALTKVAIKNVMDHVAGSGVESYPGNSGTALRAIAAGGTFATINTAAGSEGIDIANSIYPAGIPTGYKLVVLGFGPGNTANGKTIMSPPNYSGVDGAKNYDRYLCVFSVSDYDSTGKRAQLKAVIDSKGDFQAQEIAEFNQNKPD